MIRLTVEDYCQNCPEFKPYCNKFESETYCDNRPVHNVDTFVKCKKRHVCACIKEYIEAEMSKGGKDDGSRKT